MKYLLLIYGNPERWEHPIFRHEPGFLALPAERQADLVEQWDALCRELAESGEFVEGVALAHPRTAATVRVRDGVRLITDGPYAEAKEHLAGYLVVDCASAERAADIAARIPDAEFAALEIRKIF